MERTRLLSGLRRAFLIGVALIGPCLNAYGGNETADVSLQAVEKSIATDGRARVIVRLRTTGTPVTGRATSAEREQEHRLDIATRQQRIRQNLRGTKHSIRREFRSLPYVVVEIDAAGLARLQSATGDVAEIDVDLLLEPTLANSIPQVEADLAHELGYNGSGAVIAIVDTGVDNTHPFLAGKVVDEACFADREQPDGPGSCPNGSNQQFGIGAAVPCAFSPSTCRHGTHVAGISAGSGDAPGVAPSANLFALQVFHQSTACGLELSPCARAFTSDLTAALEYVYARRGQHNLAAINMSLGSGPTAAPCDALQPALAEAITNLRGAGIATVVSSGNSSSRTLIAFPACISTAIAVGAVDGADNVASFSNVSSDLDLFAPGVGIVSSIPGGGFAAFSGTSMAAPHVAGSWAVMRQANPLATVDEVLSTLTTTGRPTLDARSGGTVTRPRIRLAAALGIEAPLPVLTAITPAAMIAWSAGGTVNLLGSEFRRGSVAYVNGTARPTTFVSETELRVQISNTDLRTPATSIGLSVVTPPPGGGASATVPLFVAQPILSVDTTTANVGAPVTVTLSNSSGAGTDWIALARVTDPNSTYSRWTYVSSGASTFVWTVNMQGNPGEYHLRLFRSGSTTPAATSPTITVTPAPPPPPPVLTVDVTTANAGAPVTVTLTSGFGGASDWLALARVNDPNGTYLRWTYVGAGRTTFAWTVNMPSGAGDYQFRLFSGGNTRAATSPTVTVGGGSTSPPPPPPPPPPGSAVLAVDSTVAFVGAPVTVTLTNGSGVSNDWIALARVNDTNATYLRWTYVGAGRTTFAWTVNMPSSAGDYEFRLFSAGGFTRAATSATITVTVPPPPPPAVLAVDTAVATPGVPVSVTLTNGTGAGGAWIALARVDDPNTTYLNWTYVGVGRTTFTWTVSMPSSAGEYHFRLFGNGGYTRTATSPTILVVP